MSPLPVQLEDAGLRAVDNQGWRLRGITLEPVPGRLTVVHESAPRLATSMLDMLGGITPPDAGRARVRGTSWWSLPIDRASAWRGEINWVFHDPVWISYLTIAESITLEERYHTNRGHRELEPEATRLCARFGLPGLPLHLPAEATDEELRRAEFARAFLGDPIAIFLDDPLAKAPADLVPRVEDAIAEACGRGAAVVYCRWHDSPPALRGLDADCYTLSPTELVPEGL